MPEWILSDDKFWTDLATCELAALVTSAGLYTIRRFADWGRRNSIYYICFAAGVLISVSFLHFVPKSFTMNSRAPVYLLFGFFSLHLFNRFVTAFICEKSLDGQYGIGLVPLLGISFQSFIDGIVYSITFSVSVFTGAMAAIL